jgi:hypothetical protein
MALNGATFFVKVRLQFDNAQFTGGVNTATSGLTQVTSSVKKAGTAAESTRKQFANLAGAFTGIVAGKFAIGLIAGIVKPALAMNTALIRLKTLTNVNTTELARFRAEALRVATITPYGPQEMTDTLLKLRQATGDTATALKMLEPTAGLAMASFGQISLGQSTEIFGNMAKSFGLVGDAAMTAANRMFVASKITGTSLESYYRAFASGKIGQIKRELGATYDETIRLYGLAARGGGQPTEVATALRNIAILMGKPDVQAQLKSFGVDVMKGGQRIPLEQIVLQMMERMGGSSNYTKQMINQIFKQRAGPMLNTLITQVMQGIVDPSDPTGQRKLRGRQMLDYLRQDMLTNVDALKKAEEEYYHSPQGILSTLQETFNTLITNVGYGLLQPVADFARWARDSLDSLNKTLQESPGLLNAVTWSLKNLVYGVGGLAGLSILIGGVKIGWVALLNVLSPLGGMLMWLTKSAILPAVGGMLRLALGTKVLTGAIWLLSAAMASPALFLLGIVGAAAAAAVAIYGIYRALKYVHSEGVKFHKTAAETFSMAQAVASSPEGQAYWKNGQATFVSKQAREMAKGVVARRGATPAPGSVWSRFAASTSPMGGLAYAKAQMALENKVIKEAYDKVTKSGDSFKKNMQEGAKAITSALELLPERAKLLYDALVIGSKELSGIMDRIKGEGAYKPKVLNLSYLMKMQQKVSRAAGALPYGSELQQGLEVSAGMGQSGIDKLMAARKSGKRLSPTEHRQTMEEIGRYLSVGLTQLSTMTSGKAVSDKELKKFQQSVVDPLHSSQTQDAIGFAKTWAEMAHTGKDIPGWTRGAGYRGTWGDVATRAPKLLEYVKSDARLNPMEFGAHSIHLANPPQTMAPPMSESERMLSQMNAQNEALMNRMMSRLQTMTLKVEEQSPGSKPASGGGTGADPYGSTGVGDQ